MSSQVVVVNEPERWIEVESTQVEVIEVISGQQGPQGPPGPANTQYVDDTMTVHTMDPTPHAAYDEMVDLTLIYENGLI